MQSDIALEHLRDLVEFVVLTLGLQQRDAGVPVDDTDPALVRIEALQSAIASRKTANLPSTLLADRLALSSTEEQVLLLLVGLAMHPHLRRALGSGREQDPTADAIRELVYGAAPSRTAFDELGPKGTLRRFGLIERSDDGGCDTHERQHTWAVTRRVLAWLHGDLGLSDELDEIGQLGTDAGTLADLAVDARSAAAAREAMASPDAIIVASGKPGSGRRTLLAVAAREAGRQVLEIDARSLAVQRDALERELRSVARECRLLACVPLVRNVDILVGETTERLDLVVRALCRELQGPLMMTSGPVRPTVRTDRPIIAIDVLPPSHEQRAKLWHHKLGQGTEQDAQYLATQFPLAPAYIARAAKAARARAGARHLTPDDIDGGIRSVLDDKLAAYARRVEVSQTWDDLVLPDDQYDAIEYLLARIRQRRTVYETWGFAQKVGKGLGTTALFSGPPGTGKTMVAALIAKDLGLELYQVDMAKLVSKWIGETERNLAALFDAAEAGHAVLLFDEADALFGKRTDVKSSNDRHANQETNYLLQRLETFTGVCLLTSNHESSIDQAFQRRLAVHVRFEVPEVDERAALWRALLPAAAPVEANLGLDALARRYEMSGGYIRNAALRAAFMAADEGTAICARLLDRAARFEYEAMGKLAFG